METIVDLHAHGPEKFGYRIGSKVLEGAFPEILLRRSFNKADSTLVGLTQFGDIEYGQARLILENLKLTANRKCYSVRDHDYFISITDGDKNANFILGQEHQTNKGHVLIVGAGRPIKHFELEDVLKEARDLDSFVIADHPLFEMGLPGKIFNKINNNSTRMSLLEEDIYEFRDFFDAIETGNIYCNEKTRKKIRKLSKNLNIPLISSTDSHKDNVFHSFTTFGGLDFSNPDLLKQTLRNRLKYAKLKEGRPSSREALRHGIGALMHTFFYSRLRSDRIETTIKI